jgi:hypothetical protein
MTRRKQVYSSRTTPTWRKLKASISSSTTIMREMGVFCCACRRLHLGQFLPGKLFCRRSTASCWEQVVR